jgi:hypothetical protein
VLAKVKTRTGRIWTYVRDDRPFDGKAPPAAVFFYSRDRAGIHPSSISPAMPASFRLMLIAGSTRSMHRIESRDRSPKPAAGRIIWSLILSGVVGCGGRIRRWHRGNGLQINQAGQSDSRKASRSGFGYQGKARSNPLPWHA